MTNDTIQNFIDEQRWRDISEASNEVTRIVAIEESGSIDIIDWGQNWCSHGCYIPTHFKPLPQTDAPADVMQIAIDALRMINEEQSCGNYNAQDALAQIEARIGETKCSDGL